MAAVALALSGGACSSVDVDVADQATETVLLSSTTVPPSTTAPSTTALSTTGVPSTTAPPTTGPDEAPLPTDPEGIAAELETAELAIRDQTLTPSEAMAFGRRQQQMYRLLSAEPEIAESVITAIDPTVQWAAQQNWSARQNLSALVRSSTLSDTLPAWRIREPLPAEQLVSYYREAEAQTGIPWNYLAAINLVETRMGRIEGLSTAGAVGPMQFLPSTWDGCCEGDPAVDRDAIIGAGVYLGLVGGPDDMQAALFSYNRSQRYVDAVTAYAEVMEADPLAYLGYHAWEVYFLSSAGLVRMPPGYEETEPVDAATWIAEHPTALIS